MLTRRTMIKSTSLLALELLGGCTHLSQASLNKSNQPKKSGNIVVIGAGISGLAAASRLRDVGYSVVVLEARSRTGGRIWTEKDFMGGSIDLGASWIHGDAHNPLNDLAKAHGIKTVATDDLSYPYSFAENGSRVGLERQKNLYRIFKNDLKAEAYALQAQLKANARDFQLGDVFEQILRDLRSKSRIDVTQEMELRHLIASDIEGAYATDVSNLSLRNWDKGQWFKGSDLLLPGGYSQLVSVLGKNLDVRLNKVVTRVVYDNQEVKVLTADGSEFITEKVVITLPLGVLKHGSVAFLPQLPESKRTSISKLGVGLFNKVYLGFESSFWPEDATWIQYMGKKSSAWPTFFSLKRYTGKPILVAFNVGSFAQVLEAETDSSSVSAAMNVLKLIAKENKWAAKDPIATRVTRWGADPLSRGSYSYVPVGAEITDFDQVGAHVGERLFFAGEATNSSHYMTAHAAYLSGLRVADQISALI